MNICWFLKLWNKKNLIKIANLNCTFFQAYWGRSAPSNKIWISGIPTNSSLEYLREKFRSTLYDRSGDINYDSRYNEALLTYPSVDAARDVFSLVRQKKM